MPKISIIVPIYNAEKTLERCVSSILAQEYTDFELILVNDGSTDSGTLLCDQLASRDPRILVIHQKNGGASAARNRGMEAAHGKYLMFCDSDDVVSHKWISRLMQYADCKTLPVGSYCQQASLLGTEKSLPVPVGKKLPNTHYYAFKKSGIAGFLWNSLFIYEIIKNHKLRFRERRGQGDYNEDLLFTLQYVRHVEKIVYTGYADYFYDTHSGSLSRSYYEYYFQKYQEKFMLWRDYLEESQEGRRNLSHLSEETLYYFLVALNREFSDGNLQQFRKIVQSDAMANCLTLSCFPKENPRVIALLRKQAATRLWLLFTLIALKGRK